MAHTIRVNMKDLITCWMCRGHLKSPCWSFTCLHIFCCKCINEMFRTHQLKGGLLVCPQCKKTTPSLRKDFRSQKLLEIYKMRKIKSMRSHLEALVTCSVCRSHFENPHSFDCLHTFCYKCIKKTDGEICPLCHETSSSLTVDFKSKALLRMMQETIDTQVCEETKSPNQERKGIRSNSSVDRYCDFNSCHNRAEIYCRSCQMKFCNPCMKKHKKDYRGRKHRTEVRHRYYHCPCHPKRIAVYYCTTCKSAQCRTCFNKHERNHRFYLLRDFSAKYADIKSMLGRLKYKIRMKLDQNKELMKVYEYHSNKWRDVVKKVSSMVNKFGAKEKVFLERIAAAALVFLNELQRQEYIDSTSDFCSKMEDLLEEPVDCIMDQHDWYRCQFSSFDSLRNVGKSADVLFIKKASPQMKSILNELYVAAQTDFELVLSEIKEALDGINVCEKEVRMGKGNERKLDMQNSKKNKNIGQTVEVEKKKIQALNTSYTKGAETEQWPTQRMWGDEIYTTIAVKKRTRRRKMRNNQG